MGLLDGVIGNASKIDVTEVHSEFRKILTHGERVEHAYQLIRDYFIFTNKRFVLVDRQGLTGSKVEYHSIPYKSITHFSVETAGTFDLDAELKIWLSGSATPIQKQFNSRLNVYEVQSVLAAYVLGMEYEKPPTRTRDTRFESASESHPIQTSERDRPSEKTGKKEQDQLLNDLGIVFKNGKYVVTYNEGLFFKTESTESFLDIESAISFAKLKGADHGSF